MELTEVENKERPSATCIIPSAIRPEMPINPGNRKRTDTWFLYVFIFIITLLIVIYVIGYIPEKSDDPLGEIWFIMIFTMLVFCIVPILTSLGISIILLVLLRCATGFAVWLVLISSWLLFLIYVLMSRFPVYGDVTICFIIISVVLFLAMISNAKKINLNTLLLKEATHALFNVKAIFCVMIMVLCECLLTTFVYTGVAPSLQHCNTEFYINFVAFTWAFYFVDGVFNMTVSLEVARWYFSRNNSSFNATAFSSLWVTLKNHLGTVALVSLLSVITTIPLIILKSLSQFKVMKELTDWCMDYINGCLSKNVYIVTAIYGCPFSQSAKKGLRLFRQSIGDTKAAISFGEFVIVLSQILIALICILFNNSFLDPDYHISVDTISLTVFLMSLICTNVILGPVQIASNTIFLCTTEELLNNRETHLPYSLTEREFLDGSNNLFFEKVQNKCLTNV